MVHIVGVRLIVALADFLIQRLGFCSLEFTETFEGQNLSGGATCRAKRANICRTSESKRLLKTYLFSDFVEGQ